MKRLAELRQEFGLTQRQLAEKFNISAGNICDYEKGRIEPSIGRLIEFADFFDVSVDYLIGRSDDMGNISVNVELSSIEAEVLSSLKKLSNEEQQRVLGYVNALTGLGATRK